MAAPTRPTPQPQKAAAAKQAAPQAPAAPAAPPEEPKAPRGGGGRRGMLVPAIIVAVALLGAAYVMKGDGGGSSNASTPTTVAEPAVETGDPSEVVALDAVTLNLADGRFLKLGIALQLAPETEVADPSSFGARALDVAIDLMGAYTYNELSERSTLTKAKEKVSEAVSEAYDGDVLRVYFTEFVMQ